jgi:hypothetical protein
MGKSHDVDNSGSGHANRFSADPIPFCLSVTSIGETRPSNSPDGVRPSGIGQFRYNQDRVVLSWNYSQGLSNLFLPDGSVERYVGVELIPLSDQKCPEIAAQL